MLIKLFTIPALSVFFLCTPVIAANFEVDEADSLDFESFHKEDKAEIGILKPKRPVNFEAEAESAATGKNVRTTYMARTRFTLHETSAKTPFNAVTVITAQAQQMAETCPAGWLKIKNWIVPIEGDYYDHIEFACLD